jgi:2-dehydropantoate 2-reductase
MRILIMGAGGLGGYFGGALAQCGHDVTFVARGAHLAALREHGLELRIGAQRIRVQPVNSVDHPAQAGADFELIIFAVKTYDSAAAIEALRPAVGPGSAILTLQNGVDSIDELAQAFGPEHVLAGPSYIISALVEPGVVETAPPRRMALAELAGQPTPRLEAIASAIRELGVDVTVSDDARRALWEKFVPQAANATISSVCQLPAGHGPRHSGRIGVVPRIDGGVMRGWARMRCRAPARL